MQVHKTDRFFTELEAIVDFIAQDSFKRAEKFAIELSIKINDLPHFPYKCRQSQKSHDINIRELIFEGYIIPYCVDSAKENIVVLGIFSENEWKL